MIKAIKHSWLTVIMLIVVCMALFIGYTELFVEDQYESKYIIKSSLQYKTVKKVLTSHATYKAIDDQTGQASGTTAKSMTLSRQSKNITISVSTDDATLSKKIADGLVSSLETAYPNKVTIVTSAVVANSASQKNLIDNTLIGVLSGLALGIVYIILYYLYHRTN